MSPRWKQIIYRRWRSLALLILFIIGLLHTAHTSFFVCDDAYITFRYARNFGLHGELTYNLGEAVEGYSNFLWTLILSLFASFQFSLPRIALFLSACATLGTLAGLYYLTTSLYPSSDKNHSGAKTRLLLPLFGPAICVAWAPFTTWTAGGLETMLFTALITWGIAFAYRGFATLTAVTIGLAALTRPEGILFGALTLTYLGLRPLHRAIKSRNPRALFPIMDGSALFIVMIGGHLLFRHYYYGEFLPNTYYTKMYGIPTPFLWHHGKQYASGFLHTYHLSWLLMLMPGFLFIGRRRLPFLLFLVTLVTIWGLYIMRSGGDFMAMHRFFVPLIPSLALLITFALAGWAKMAQKLGHSPAVARNLSLYLLMLVCALISVSSIIFERASIKSERRQLGMESVRGMINYVADRVKVGKALNQAIGHNNAKNVTMAVGGAGAISFESGVGRAIDTFGLMDKKIARRRIKPGKFYKPGHLKLASWSYVRLQHPHLLCSPGIATIGMGIPSKKQQKRVLAYFSHYEYFCLRLTLSKDDDGRRRTHYCCLKRRGLFPDLTL